MMMIVWWWDVQGVLLSTKLFHFPSSEAMVKGGVGY